MSTSDSDYSDELYSISPAYYAMSGHIIEPTTTSPRFLSTLQLGEPFHVDFQEHRAGTATPGGPAKDLAWSSNQSLESPDPDPASSDTVISCGQDSESQHSPDEPAPEQSDSHSALVTKDSCKIDHSALLRQANTSFFHSFGDVGPVLDMHRERIRSLENQLSYCAWQRRVTEVKQNAATHEHNNLNTKHLEVLRQRDALTAQCRALTSIREDLQHRRDTLRKTVDVYSASHRALMSERDKLLQDRVRLLKRQRFLVAHRNILRKHRDALEKERDHLERVMVVSWVFATVFLVATLGESLVSRVRR